VVTHEHQSLGAVVDGGRDAILGGLLSESGFYIVEETFITSERPEGESPEY